MFLDQFIALTDKQPKDWTSLDIQRYVDYGKAQAAAGTTLKRYERLPDTSEVNPPSGP
ncbi:MAG: hypothetical protein ACYC7L_13285 [Nitrospirota bacterium]